VVEAWGLFCNGLWLVGLAVCLATLSLAVERAWAVRGARALQGLLASPGYRRTLTAGLALVVVGAILSVWTV
jgi:hypothetical protein